MYFYSLLFSARQHICYSALYDIARPSVRPSVCLSVTRVDQSKTVTVRITQPSPQSSPTTLVSWRRTAPWNSNGKIGSGGAKYERGMKKRHFQPLPVKNAIFSHCRYCIPIHQAALLSRTDRGVSWAFLFNFALRSVTDYTACWATRLSIWAKHGKCTGWQPLSTDWDNCLTPICIARGGCLGSLALQSEWENSCAKGRNIYVKVLCLVIVNANVIYAAGFGESSWTNTVMHFSCNLRGHLLCLWHLYSSHLIVQIAATHVVGVVCNY